MKSEAKRNRVLLRELIKTDFKLRYQGSILGYLWAVLKPLLMFAILYVVFAQILRFGGDVPHFPVYLLAGIVVWNFFAECTGLGIHAIEARGDLIRKISFPKSIVVISATSTAVINLLINVLVTIVFALINGVAVSWGWILVPFALAEVYLLALGISFLLGAIQVKYKDIGSIWEVFMQAAFYAVPIIYPLSMVTATSVTAAKILLLNPIAQAIQDVRYFLITPETLTTWNFVGVGWEVFAIFVTLAIFLFGVWFFQKRADYFAEEV